MSNENIILDKPPAYLTIGSGMLGGGVMGFFCLGIKGLYIGISLGFIIGLLFYIHERINNIKW